MHEFYNLFVAILLGVIEGVTEFIPVSSTGHMVLCQWWLGIDLDDPFWKLFVVFIQIGAICAVLVYFRERLTNLLTGHKEPGISLSPIQRHWVLWMIAIGTLPVLIVGYLTHKWVEAHLGSPVIVGLALGIGGVLMILIELLPLRPRTERIESMTIAQALGIGIAQILAAIFPGTSRSFVTIMGGMLAGMTRQAATEFSFFLAIPAMFAACGYDLFKHRHDLHSENILLLIIGTLVAFLVAWVVIAAFMGYIRKHNFVPFGIWRIAVAILVFLTWRHVGA